MPSNTTFRRATQADAEGYYKGRPVISFRGWVAEQEGAVVAIGGISYVDGAPMAFSEMTDSFRKSRKDVARGCRILMEMVDNTKGPVYAVADPNEPTASYLLLKLGWLPTGRYTQLGELLVRV